MDFQNPLRTVEVRAEGELAADPNNVTVHKLAIAYGLDESKPAHAGEDHYTISYRSRRVVALHCQLEKILLGRASDE